MVLSVYQMAFVVGTVTYIMSITAIVLAAVITQGVYCDNAHSYCNLIRADDVYTWYFVNKSNINDANCIYYGDFSLSENTWQIVPCFDNVDVNNTNINNSQNLTGYDAQNCPQQECGKWFISTGLFNTAEWLFIIGGGMISTILSLVVCCYLGKKIKQQYMDHKQSQQFNYHDITVVIDDFSGVNNNSVNASNTEYNAYHNNTNPYISNNTIDPIPALSPIAIYVENA